MPLRASGLLERHGLDLDALALRRVGPACSRGPMLRDGDRVEIYRGLIVDPKEARRLRYARDKKRKAPGTSRALI